jgi:RNA recognition motif-containing protein
MQVYVGNLSRHITDKQFGDLVSPFGKPDTLSVPREQNGRGKGYGLLEYANPDGQILNARATDAANG